MADTILVVEDDPTLLRSICRNLSVRGYEARGVTTVADALAALDDTAPTVVVADVDLPDGSGWEVVRALRERGQSRVAVIVMSALRPNQRLADELGVTALLEKPFPIASLLRLVEQASRGPVAPSAGDEPLADEQ